MARVAADADVVIVAVGNDPHLNGRETGHRATLAPPDHQDRLWRAAHAENPRTALVHVSSCAASASRPARRGGWNSTSPSACSVRAVAGVLPSAPGS